MATWKVVDEYLRQTKFANSRAQKHDTKVKTKSSQTKWALTNICSCLRLGELLNTHRAAEISFKSLKFMLNQRYVILIQGVGSIVGTTPAAKYWSRKEKML